MGSGYWGHIRQWHYKGPVWELPNGVQLTLDYHAVSLFMELLKQGSGDCFLHQRRGGKGEGVTHSDTLWAKHDGERVFFEMFRSYPRTDSDLIMLPGGHRAVPPGMDAEEAFFAMWQPDYSTSVQWQWTPAEFEVHLAEPNSGYRDN